MVYASHLSYLYRRYHDALFVCALLDFLTTFPLAIIVLFAMLQDRRRPLWPVGVMMAPIIVGMTVCIATRSDAIFPLLYTYFLLLGIGLLIYMVRATRQYGHWLRDNYADLEHKEVWQSMVVLAVILLFFGIYTLDPYYRAVKYIMQVNNIILVCYLLWRVETLSELNMPVNDAEEDQASLQEPSLTLRNDIEPLLKKYCEEPQLYLQPDLTLFQLAKAVGTNRYYLSQYFSCLNMNYNTYINHLRIQHFMNLYREAVAVQQSITARQLAIESGFRTYRTFSNAFKNQIGQTVTEWIRAASRAQQGQSAS